MEGQAAADQLLEELQRLLNALLVIPPPLTAAQPHTAQFCTLIEHILSRGLKKRVFSSLNLWEVLERLEESLPGMAAFVKQVRSSATTPHGRVALWIRHALRERRLGEYLQALRFHPDLVAKSYETDAPFAADEFASAFLLQLETAAALEFHFLWQEGSSLDSSPLLYTHVSMPDHSNAGALVHGTTTATPDKKIEAVSNAVALPVLQGCVRDTLRQVLVDCGPYQLLDDRTTSVASFLAALHAALGTGLRSALLIERHVWDAVRELPSATADVALVEERYPTATLRLHAFFRLALNGSALANVVRDMAANRPLVDAFYTDDSLLRHTDDLGVLVTLLDSLASIKCCFSLEMARIPQSSGEMPVVRRKAAGKKRTPMIDGDSPMPSPVSASVPSSLPNASFVSTLSSATASVPLLSPLHSMPFATPASSTPFTPLSQQAAPHSMPSFTISPVPLLSSSSSSSVTAITSNVTAPISMHSTLATPVAAPVALSPGKASVAEAVTMLSAVTDELSASIADLEFEHNSNSNHNTESTRWPSLSGSGEADFGGAYEDSASVFVPAVATASIPVLRPSPQLIGPVPTPPPVRIAFLDPPPSPRPSRAVIEPQQPPASPMYASSDEDGSDDGEPEGDDIAQEYQPQANSTFSDARKTSVGAANNGGTLVKRESFTRRVVDDKPVPDASSSNNLPSNIAQTYVKEVFSSRTAPAASMCATCGTPLSNAILARLRDAYRFCYYTGLWYCIECHANGRAVLPARAVLKWDLRVFPVCIAAQSVLSEAHNTPLLNVSSLNEELYQSAPMGAVREQRERLVQLGEYVHTCAERGTLVTGLGTRAYLLDSVHLYSLRDLVEAHGGTLLPKLQQWVAQLTAHVVKCPHCRGKGFVCERCAVPGQLSKVIFPFQPNTLRCLQCRALYHTACFSADFQCLKCARIRQVRGKLKPGSK